MDPLITFKTAFDSIKVALEISSHLKDLDNRFKDSEYKENILKLKNTILSIKDSLLEAKNENLELQEKVNYLKEQLQDKSEIKFDGIVYWKVTTDLIDGPFCPICYSKSNNKVYLHRFGDDRHTYICRLCHSQAAVFNNVIKPSKI